MVGGETDLCTCCDSCNCTGNPAQGRRGCRPLWEGLWEDVNKGIQAGAIRVRMLIELYANFLAQGRRRKQKQGQIPLLAKH